MKRRINWRCVARTTLETILGFAIIMAAYAAFFFCLLYPDEMGVARMLRGALP